MKKGLLPSLWHSIWFYESICSLGAVLICSADGLDGLLRAQQSNSGGGGGDRGGGGAGSGRLDAGRLDR